MIGPLSFARRIFQVLPRKERRGLIWLFPVVLLAAAFETLGVASILPFMAVVTDPSVLERSQAAQTVLGAVGLTETRSAVVAVGVMVVLVLMVGNLATAVSHWLQHSYLAKVQQELSSELFAGFLAQPYAFHVNRDAASLSTTVFNHVSAVLNHAVSPLLLAITRGVVALCLLSLLLLRDPFVAVIAVLVLGAGYLAIYQILRGRQTQLGKVMAESGEERYRLVMEGLGGVKELLVLGRERDTLQRFHRQSGMFFQSASRNVINSMLPRYLLETVAFGGIVLVTIILVLRGGGVETLIPTLALYAFVGYRLMPALQQIFASAISLRFAGAAVQAVEADLGFVRGAAQRVPPAPARKARVPACGRISLSHVSFTYPGADVPALHDISLDIEPNECVGLVGRTGSGKTTLADLILGLHEPSFGTLSVDGNVVDRDNIRDWRSQLGYVPQGVFLANATVAENIAFGLAPRDVDEAAVRRAARLAQAEDFIRALPHGLDTVIGERGVKLSGGQRQRLGIARALYHDPSVLVFDEATSALDGMTEEAVMEALRALTSTRTILLIAHRMRTVEACDRIFMLDRGRLIASGRYTDLRDRSADFRQLLGPAMTSEAAV